MNASMVQLSTKVRQQRLVQASHLSPLVFLRRRPLTSNSAQPCALPPSSHATPSNCASSGNSRPPVSLLLHAKDDQNLAGRFHDMNASMT
jgi:hypothetical protein